LIAANPSVIITHTTITDAVPYQLVWPQSITPERQQTVWNTQAFPMLYTETATVVCLGCS
jgi:hypothetical protein